MKVIEIKDKIRYNNYLIKQKHSQFLQAWEWGNIQADFGQKVIRLGCENNGSLVLVMTLIKKAFPFGKSYFYSPRVDFSNLTADDFKVLKVELARYAKQDNVLFWRFEPTQNLDKYNLKLARTIDVQPSKTIILDISKAEDELLQVMHKKTRYNIRLAERKGVKIIKDGKERFSEFWNIMEETGSRDGFRLHGKSYYEKMLMNDEVAETGKDKLALKLYLAEYKGKIIAGNIVSFFGDMAVYVHGASSNQYRNVMAPYLLQWQAIRDAREAGCGYYDFFGIDELKWPGVTRFKKGFNGELIEYPGTFDLVFDKVWYNVYKVVRMIRRRGK